MTIDFADVPLWAAIAASAFILLGAGLSLLGAIGLVRLKTFYERLHAPTLATSWGTAGMAIGSMIIFTTGSGRLVLHEILIALFVTVTTPITLMMLGRATLYRDGSEGNVTLPAGYHGPEQDEADLEEEPGEKPGQA
ncbi:MAG TPA: monovalent cation/H(+) antiporter subunit G [Rhizobiaceae bacterium]|nr:monovalent cation/H(+) antiporter subunit G [Rhizobiaceae bacterium]